MNKIIPIVLLFGGLTVLTAMAASSTLESRQAATYYHRSNI